MTALVTPRLKVVTDSRGVHTVLLGENTEFDELPRPELLRRCFVPELETLRHAELLSLVV